MAQILPVNDNTPQFGENCWLADNAVITGDTILGDRCSVWFHAVIRGDVNTIRIGNEVNVQDGAVLHCTYQRAALNIGNKVSIGHRALVHGCTVEDEVLIGMGAIVMDHAHVHSRCLIAAGAVVTEKMICESGWIYAGVPAKPVKKLSEELFKGEIERIAKNYLMYAGWYG